MRARTLGIAFGLITLFATWPMFTWLGAQFNWLDDRWFASLGSLVYTFPIALAFAAVVFVLHGMLLNAELAADLEERFNEASALPEGVVAPGQRVPVGAMATSGTAAGVTAGAADPTVEFAVDAGAAAEEPAKTGGKMAVAPRPEGFKGEDGKKKKKKVGKVGKQVGRRWGYKAKGAVRRGIRDRIGIRF